ncbi:hypothetical protein [Amedibacterium intestinale]|jgi:hypothetical protein|uniref:hypothetical protein n=1 Tax=Amedibacterium intestinale TaxID=2583452 RepID=UPI000E4A40CF|nr:hypothetical protein [Amedibacterium intestinale]RHO22170.1 hypothetical protein DW220_05245 [Eubacterium sp. AM18-26]RHO26768.1 hypothetical protein DW212_04665 [Eubacterium sp. AM18-10LB-B]RHO32473.1 hypothetical protein DW208_03460 [Erysipelotrichaceae bacterium AM17-60]BBK61927.1 hypothetical protein A9CBEGH2_08670 [Amedibacterium intestinale]
MKRFIWDALLVFLLVAVGSYVQNKETSSMDITQKVQQFEQDIATQKNVSKQVQTNEIQKENRASRMAKTTSDLVVDAVKETAGLFAIVFDGVQK